MGIWPLLLLLAYLNPRCLPGQFSARLLSLQCGVAERRCTIASMIDYFDIYEPLLPGHLPEGVRYVIVIGGRGSAKSFHTSTAIVAHSDMDANTILYTRFTMVAANVSIIPEYTEKIDLAGMSDRFSVKATEIHNTRSGGKILFRGIMQGSKNQTARLKSIPNVKLFALDEAEELVDESSFDTIDFSLRKIGVQSLLWVVLNPSDVTHWIYRRFFAKVINQLSPNTTTIIGDTCYIWTTYEINPHLDRAFLDLAEKMANNDPDKYRNVFLGYWNTRKEGLIFPRWQRIDESEIPIGLPMWYGLDWGYGGDETGLVAMYYEPTGCVLYVREVVYKTGLLLPALAKIIIEDGKAHGLPPSECLVYCDPARPDNRDQLRVVYGINAVNGENRDKAGRIGYLQGFNVKYAGAGIHTEVTNYSWQPNPNDRTTYTDKPQDGADHLMDATNYGATHLRRLGVSQM